MAEYVMFSGKFLLAVMVFQFFTSFITVTNAVDSGSTAKVTDCSRTIRLIHGTNVYQPNGAGPEVVGRFHNKATVLSTDSKPSDERFWPTVGNGHVATVVHSDTVFMNGLYNGKETSSRRARIPAMTSLDILNISQECYKNFKLDMSQGMYIETCEGPDWYIQLKIYAHRTLTRLLVTELTLRNDNTNPKPINVTLNVTSGLPSNALNLTQADSDLPDTNFWFGRPFTPELNTSELVPVHIYHSEIPPFVVLPRDVIRTDVHLFLASFSPFREEAKQYFETGLEVFKNQTLGTSHVIAWSEVWERGRIDIDGNLTLASQTYSALYYILSAMPTQEETTWPFIGLSPEDLAHGNKYEEYGGHVFWDQETWMYPPVLTLHSDLGKTLVNTRMRTLDSSYLYAQNRGYEGAMYPWESAFTGLNVSPGGIWAKYEMHITGDIALAFRQYLMMTRDTDLIKHGRLGEAINSIADFWVSRSTLNESSKRYEIWDVMPPDEWSWPVNNSVYTNEVAKISLLLPGYAHTLGGRLPPTHYQHIADRMYIPFDNQMNYHPEYEDYTPDIVVKQADVVLLGYPLMVNMTEEVRRNDLRIYGNRTASGPAMTWGMFAIGWLEVGEPEKAKELFLRQLKNSRKPFNVWTELANGYGATNFITGMGGYLQSLLFGYGGLRMFKTHLTLDPTPIPETTAFNITGLDYLGSSINIHCAPNVTSVTLTRQGAMNLYMYVYSTKGLHKLQMNTPVLEPRQKIAIVSEEDLPNFTIISVEANSSIKLLSPLADLKNKLIEMMVNIFC